jgi:membrane protein required for colicin V production
MDTGAILSSLPPFSTWDYVVGCVVLVSSIFGYFRGLISTVFGLLGWACAVLSAWLLTPQIAQMFALDTPTVLLRIGVFFGVYLIMRMLGFAVARATQAVGLGGMDRPLGAVFGAARALFLVAVLITVLQWTNTARFLSWQGSVCQPVLDAIADWAKQMAPPPAPSTQST